MRLSKIVNDQVGELTISSLEYSVTYAGAMCCSFSQEYTDNRIQSELQRFEKWYNHPLFYISGPNTALHIYFENDSVLDDHIVLPYWQCIATLNSGWNDEEEYQKGSLVSILWFQDEQPWPLSNAKEIINIKIDFSSQGTELELADHMIKYMKIFDWKKSALKYSNEF